MLVGSCNSKFDFNKVAMHFHWNYNSSWVFCKFAVYFRNIFRIRLGTNSEENFTCWFWYHSVIFSHWRSCFETRSQDMKTNLHKEDKQDNKNKDNAKTIIIQKQNQRWKQICNKQISGKFCIFKKLWQIPFIHFILINITEKKLLWKITLFVKHLIFRIPPFYKKLELLPFP